MREETNPFSVKINFSDGLMKSYHNKTMRKLSEMRHFFSDTHAVDAVLRQDDRIIYEAYEIWSPKKEGQLSYCTTIIHPGCIGKEYHMTKGHFHLKDKSSEMYIGLQGNGCLLVQARENQAKLSSIRLESGIVAYVPPGWGHRVVNTGNQDLIIMAIYASDAGHDYGFIQERGFSKLLVKEGDHPALVKNPKYV